MSRCIKTLIIFLVFLISFISVSYAYPIIYPNISYSLNFTEVWFNSTQLGLGSNTISYAKSFYSPNGYFIILVRDSGNYIRLYHYFVENNTLINVYNAYLPPARDHYAFYCNDAGSYCQNNIVFARSDNKGVYDIYLSSFPTTYSYYSVGSSTYTGIDVKENAITFPNYFLWISPPSANEPTTTWNINQCYVSGGTASCCYYFLSNYNFNYNLYSGGGAEFTDYGDSAIFFYTYGGYSCQYFYLVRSSTSPYPTTLNFYNGNYYSITLLSSSVYSSAVYLLRVAPISYYNYLVASLIESGTVLNITYFKSNSFTPLYSLQSSTNSIRLYDVYTYKNLGFVSYKYNNDYYVFVVAFDNNYNPINKKVIKVKDVDTEFFSDKFGKIPTSDALIQYTKKVNYNSTHIQFRYRKIGVLTVLGIDERDYQTILGCYDYTPIYNSVGNSVIGSNPFIWLNSSTLYLYQTSAPSSYSSSDIYIYNSQPTEYKVYNLQSSYANLIQFNLQNAPSSCENYILRFERLYTDGFKYVKDTFFDYNCIATAYLEANQVYRLYVIEKSSGNTIFSTSGFKIAQNTYSINLGTQPTTTKQPYYSYFNLYGYNLTYYCNLDANNNLITCFVNNPDTRQISVSFEVKKPLIFSNYTICQQTIKSASMTFTCNLDNSTDEYYVSLVWNDYNVPLWQDVMRIARQVFVNAEFIFVGALIVIALMLIGVYNPFLSLTLGIIGLIITAVLNLIPLSISTVIGLFIVVLIIKYKEGV